MTHRQLTHHASLDRYAFDLLVSRDADPWRCECAPPDEYRGVPVTRCKFCTHPGNPVNQENNPNCWLTGASISDAEQTEFRDMVNEYYRAPLFENRRGAAGLIADWCEERRLTDAADKWRKIYEHLSGGREMSPELFGILQESASFLTE